MGDRRAGRAGAAPRVRSRAAPRFGLSCPCRSRRTRGSARRGRDLRDVDRRDLRRRRNVEAHDRWLRGAAEESIAEPGGAEQCGDGHAPRELFRGSFLPRMTGAYSRHRPAPPRSTAAAASRRAPSTSGARALATAPDTLAGMLLGHKVGARTQAFNQPETSTPSRTGGCRGKPLRDACRTSPLRTSHMRDPGAANYPPANSSWMKLPSRSARIRLSSV